MLLGDIVSAEGARELSRRWRKHTRQGASVAPDARIGFAASFTIDPLIGYCGALLVGSGKVHPHITNANYNQLVRTCLDPSSELGEGPFEAIVLLWRIEDLTTTSQPEAMASAMQTLLGSVRQLRDRFAGTIIVSMPPRPRPVYEGLVGFSRPSALAHLWFEAQAQVSALSTELANTYTVDIESAIAALGEREALDYRNEVLYRQPYTESLFVALAQKIIRIYDAKRREPKKCIAVDCDNTLWGGIIGEDGVGGVKLSDDYPGREFLEFQRQLKSLRDSGIFLALCTKNNPDDVKEMFDAHASMAIRMADVSVCKANWQPKSQNLREIAAELNIGLDAVVFVDDNPFELEEVGTHAPEVTLVRVPEDAAELPIVIKQIAALFDRLDITDDDRKRVDMMRHEVERRELSQKLTEADFLASLSLQVDLYKPRPADYARVTQLINKTNQFNVTTRRYSFEDVVAMIGDPNVDFYCATVRDKFGDYGLVGVGIVKHEEGVSQFDTMLMSCRVLGRGVETVIISHGIELAKARGAGSIVGRYVPTRKNGMVVDVFEKHGFEGPHSGLAVEKDLVRETQPLAIPAFLSVNLTN